MRQLCVLLLLLSRLIILCLPLPHHYLLTVSYDLSNPAHKPTLRPNSRRHRKSNNVSPFHPSDDSPENTVLSLVTSQLNRLSSNSAVLPSPSISLPALLVSRRLLHFAIERPLPENARFKLNRMLPSYVRVMSVEQCEENLATEFSGKVKGSLLLQLPEEHDEVEGEGYEVFYRRYASATAWEDQDGEHDVAISATVTSVDFLSGEELVGMGGDSNKKGRGVCRVSFDVNGLCGDDAEEIVRAVEIQLKGLGERAKKGKRLKILETRGLVLEETNQRQHLDLLDRAFLRGLLETFQTTKKLDSGKLQYSIFRGTSALRHLSTEDEAVVNPNAFGSTACAALLLLRGHPDAAHEVLLGVTKTNLEEAEYAATHPGSGWAEAHPLSDSADMLHAILHRLEGPAVGEGNHTGYVNAKYWLAGGGKRVSISES